MRVTVINNLILLSLLACSSSDKSVDEAITTPSPAEVEALIGEVRGEMTASQEIRLARSEDTGKIPKEISDRVLTWLRFFTEKDRARFQNFLDRGEYYRPMIESRLTEIGVPAELYYLAMIESGFVVHASSKASAVGVWQFIKATGERYGLIVNPFVDERRDPLRATTAAGSYLRDLHTVFQSWFLAMAAYNAGESRIMGAIMKSGTRNFWQLAAKRALPSETMNYVPKFIAASMIGHHPEKFGFRVNKAVTLPRYTRFDVPARSSLDDIAASLKIPQDDLKAANPHIRKNLIAVPRAQYQLWIDEKYASHLEEYSEKLSRLSVKDLDFAEISHPEKKPLTSKPSPDYHVVRRGDTLASVAKKHGVSIAFIKQRNHLKSSTLFPGRRLMLNPNQTYTQANKAPVTAYRVRRGDSLTSIASRHGLRVTTLKNLNNLKRNHVYTGEVLKLKPKG
jgi:membrane-bound lytic murein transglycosylase D